MAISKADIVINNKFRDKLDARGITDVSVVIPKAKTTNYECPGEADVDLNDDRIAFSIELEDGEEGLICSGNTRVTRLKRTGDSYDALCYDTTAVDPWVTRTPDAEDAYECNGNTYYVGSLEGDNSGQTCAEYKEQWLQNKCCSAYNAAICSPILQGYEAEGCGTCS